MNTNPLLPKQVELNSPNSHNPSDNHSFINKWSWGGFLLYPVVYFLGSRNYKKSVLYFFGFFVPVLDIYLWIKSGLRGRKMVWESGKWQDFESYQRRQKLLDKIAFILIVIIIFVSIIFFILGQFGKPRSQQKTLSNENPTLVSQTPTTTESSQSNIPLEIIQATITPSVLTYPFSDAILTVVLRNNSLQHIKEYKYRFFLDEDPYFGHLTGNRLTDINPGAIYQMDSYIMQDAINALVKSCDLLGLESSFHLYLESKQYHLHLKISLDTIKPLKADTTGPLVTDKLIPFMIDACDKKK